ncbi:type III pantothenate kinase [Tsukamurella sp. 8F]|uniref:type III pantothenate kinase n=1 Tax=unclassified Tsukamurella TaxID=2633480 RepID=UPI0023BA0E98|nr:MULTISPECIES: type III pantothenate kinase [unclassified Tsukamurella]MDF0530910.1 type III pantothenate kinase [Tsukamurella sp. 8J]MDF0588235.1 type III pantothenate kinase [Tsukamurella sp. 8F]
MLLAIDAGNTSVSLGLFPESEPMGSEPLGQWRIRSDARMTADELALQVRGMLSVPTAAVTGVCALSTVPELLRSIRAMLPRYLPDAAPVLLAPGVKTGVPLHVDNPREVGTDRVANAAAAHEIYGGPCIIVDLGTSFRVDAVSAKGEFLGGAIAPGMDIALDALADRTVALRRVEMSPPRSVVGKNTVEALQAGVLLGFAALIDGLVERARDEVPELADATVVATGGDTAALAHTRTVELHRPDLTLQGLRVVYGRESARRRR